MKSPPDERCLIIIDDKEYDVTTFKKTHPGGPEILEKYNGKDATDVFNAFHRPNSSATRLLAVLSEKARPTSFPQTDAIREFRQLRQKLVNEGALEPVYGWYVWKFSSTLALGALALALGHFGHWILSALVLGLFWQQMAFIGHDLGHNGVFFKRETNTIVGTLVSHLAQGISASWWNVRHNIHHSITNVLDVDQDIDHMPLFCYDERDLARVQPGSLASRAIPYQHYLFWGLIPFLRTIWFAQSIEQVASLRTSPVADRRRRFSFEATSLALFWVWYSLYLYFYTPSGWFYTMVSYFLSQTVSGGGLVLIVFLSHNACDIFAADQRKDLNFLELQFFTTRNFNPGVVLDWFAGGLNYQVEHHLFPMVPRQRMNALSKEVKLFAQKHNLPYQCENYFKCIGLLQDRLYDVAMAMRKVNAQREKEAAVSQSAN